MERKWTVIETVKKNKRCFPQLEKATEQILLNRGFENEKELKCFFTPDYEKDLHDPFLLNDMKKAVERILNKKTKLDKICIFGDYDADGVTGSVLLTSFLKKELKLNVFSYIPDREEEGYGMSERAIDYLKKQNTTLIITVDCGITNVEEVFYAKKSGIDVIILDHHDVVEKIPKALAVIDPKNPQEKRYPFKELAGVGVAFKFLQAISRKSSEIKEDNLKWYLDLVAVGTVADCVPLLNENRTLVKFGLMVLAKTKRAGFRQLFQNGRIQINESELPKTEQIAFQIAPRINAAGRMKHAKMAYNLLMEENETKANEIAKELEKENRNRQKVTADILKKMKKKLNAMKKIPKVIIKTSAEWKIGIIGLIAGRLAEEFSRPVILLQEKGDIFRGSGRSIPGFDLVGAFKKQAGLLNKYGGHNQAAGLTLSKENFFEFKESFQVEAEKKIIRKLIKTILIDIKVTLKEINAKFCEEISMLEPFGKENELPTLLLKKANIINKKRLGKDDKHLKLWIEGYNGTEILEGIGFGMGERTTEIKINDKIDLIFNLEKNYWNGTRKLQLKLIDFKKSKN